MNELGAATALAASSTVDTLRQEVAAACATQEGGARLLNAFITDVFVTLTVAPPVPVGAKVQEHRVIWLT